MLLCYQVSDNINERNPAETNLCCSPWENVLGFFHEVFLAQGKNISVPLLCLQQVSPLLG